MGKSGMELEMEDLFDDRLQAWTEGSVDDQRRTRDKWFEKYPIQRGDGLRSAETIRVGIRVLGDEYLAGGSGVISLATVLATEGGKRSATLGEIREACLFWATGEITENLFGRGYHNHHSAESKVKWFRRDPSGGWCLTDDAIRQISPHVRKLLKIYLTVHGKAV